MNSLRPWTRSAFSFLLAFALFASLGDMGFAQATEVKVAQKKEEEAPMYLVFFGTYTSGDSEGIYSCRFDTQSGEVSDVKLAAETENPSFVAIHPNENLLVAVNETVDYKGEKSGYVSSFVIEARKGTVREINQQASRGGAPCHVVIDAEGKHVLVANYVGGNVVSLPIRAYGQLSEVTSEIQHEGSGANKARQEGPHAHSINLDPSNRYAVAADLGTDRLYIHRFDAETGKLTPNQVTETRLPAGSGPRHFTFHPNGQHAFVINELLCTVSALKWDPDFGTLKILDSLSTLPREKGPGDSTAEVVVHPNGKWVYGSNRGHDSLAIFEWDETTESLSLVGHQKTLGKTPRNFAIEPSGHYLFAANQGSDFVTVFEIDQQKGTLSEVNRIKVPSPVCVRFLKLER